MIIKVFDALDREITEVRRKPTRVSELIKKHGLAKHFPDFLKNTGGIWLMNLVLSVLESLKEQHEKPIVSLIEVRESISKNERYYYSLFLDRQDYEFSKTKLGIPLLVTFSPYAIPKNTFITNKRTLEKIPFQEILASPPYNFISFPKQLDKRNNLFLFLSLINIYKKYIESK